jgi:hypothetical protein
VLAGLEELLYRFIDAKEKKMPEQEENINAQSQTDSDFIIRVDQVLLKNLLKDVLGRNASSGPCDCASCACRSSVVSEATAPPLETSAKKVYDVKGVKHA